MVINNIACLYGTGNFGLVVPEDHDDQFLHIANFYVAHANFDQAIHIGNLIAHVADAFLEAEHPANFVEPSQKAPSPKSGERVDCQDSPHL